MTSWAISSMDLLVTSMIGHTGGMANSDMAVDALFRKAGIVRCFGREELTTVASVMLHPPLGGKNLAIITHAGGPAVIIGREKEKITAPGISSPGSVQAACFCL